MSLRVSMHPFKHIYATGGSLHDGIVKIWSWDSNKCLAELYIGGEINGLQWIDDDHLIIGLSF
jgi:WD40 repeat protein